LYASVADVGGDGGYVFQKVEVCGSGREAGGTTNCRGLTSL
jgi:hypothetical protein